MLVYTIYYHYIHYKPYISHHIDTTKDLLDLHISILELNKNIIIDDIVKKCN